MSRRHRVSASGTGYVASWWPVLLSLLIVLIPTVCVLWFMTEAMENRRLMVRRSLADADLVVAQERLDSYWREQASELDRTWAAAASGSSFFRECVEGKLADSVVCYDPEGRLIYPAPARPSSGGEGEGGVDWAAAEKLEFTQDRLTDAAAAYQAIAAAHVDPAKESFNADLAARALVAKARCLAKAGRTEDAIDELAGTLGEEPYGRAVDAEGRLIVAGAELRALELIAEPTDPRFRTVVERLSNRLNDYCEPTLAASQRVFLMRQARSLIEERLGPPDASFPVDDLAALLRRSVEFPTLPAEQLAAEFCEANPVPSKEAAVRLTQTSGVWQLALTNRQVVALFRTGSVATGSQEAISVRPLNSGAQVMPVAPGALPSSAKGVPAAEAGRYLPGWRLEHIRGDGADFEPIDDAKTVAYFWTGILVIAAMAIFAAIIARAFRQQMRLTHLKNDLVATVSHELKTPLSSIRLLVDTLLDEAELEESKVREYLTLVAKENMRLSRLIDNFLAFSRMERKKHAFEFSEVRIADVVDSAVEVARERFDRPDCHVHVDVAADLPPVEADADALVTVLLNLIDNAYKYSADDVQISVSAYADNGNVCLEVTDNGMGLPKASARKVFKRFYQVDRRVSRETGGVGLGLSIVQFIVNAHDGSVRVRSRPGQGSTFSVTIPCVPAGHRRERG